MEHSSSLLYFGSLPIALLPVAGSVIPFSPSDWAVDASSAPAVVAKAAPRPEASSPSAPPVVVPAVPSLDLRCVCGGGSPPRTPDARVPPPLSAPLIKVPLCDAPSDALRGVASGTRSALVCLSGDGRGSRGAWYRLKGCGNDDAGFMVRQSPPLGAPLPPGVSRWRDIRGSAFPKEALTELVMAERVRAALEKRGSLAANSAVGFALYSAPQQLPLGPDFPTACIIEGTLGDRRLGTHVLAGLEVLLPLLLAGGMMPHADAAAAAAAIKSPRHTCTPPWGVQPPPKGSPPGTRGEARAACGCGWGGGNEPPAATEADDAIVALLTSAFPVARPREALATDVFVEDHVLALSAAFMTPEEEGAPHPTPASDAGFCWQLPRDENTLADVTASPRVLEWFARAERACAASICSAAPPPQCTREGARAMSSEWLPLWADGCIALRDALLALPPNASALVYLYSRLGSDVGAIMCGLADAGISWGTYQDAMTSRSLGEWHCNAHSNNLVVVPPAGGIEGAAATASASCALAASPPSHRLLAALDFDMAFDAASYVDTQTGIVGQSARNFRALLDFERCQMMSVLSGADSTSGVPANVLPYLREHTRAGVSRAKWLLTDALVLAYVREGNGLGGGPAFDPLLHAAAHALMRLAIIVMGDCVA